MRYTKKWTKERVAVLKKMYGKYPASVIAAKVGTTAENIHSVVSRLKITIEKWTPEAEQYMIDNYYQISTTQMIKDMREKFGLKKNTAAIHSRWQLLKKRN